MKAGNLTWDCELNIQKIAGAHEVYLPIWKNLITSVLDLSTRIFKENLGSSSITCFFHVCSTGTRQETVNYRSDNL